MAALTVVIVVAHVNSCCPSTLKFDIYRKHSVNSVDIISTMIGNVPIRVELRGRFMMAQRTLIIMTKVRVRVRVRVRVKGKVKVKVRVRVAVRFRDRAR
jgi:hypothetical protein